MTADSAGLLPTLIQCTIERPIDAFHVLMKDRREVWFRAHTFANRRVFLADVPNADDRALLLGLRPVAYVPWTGPNPYDPEVRAAGAALAVAAGPDGTGGAAQGQGPTPGLEAGASGGAQAPQGDGPTDGSGPAPDAGASAPNSIMDMTIEQLRAKAKEIGMPTLPPNMKLETMQRRVLEFVHMQAEIEQDANAEGGASGEGGGTA